MAARPSGRTRAPLTSRYSGHGEVPGVVPHELEVDLGAEGAANPLLLHHASALGPLHEVEVFESAMDRLMKLPPEERHAGLMGMYAGKAPIADFVAKYDLVINVAKVVGGMQPVERVMWPCLLYTSPSPRDGLLSRMPSSA